MAENKFKIACLSLINIVKDDGVHFHFLNQREFKDGSTAHYRYNKTHNIYICMKAPYIYKYGHIVWKGLMECLAHEVGHYLREKYLLKKEYTDMTNKANLLLYNNKTPKDVRIIMSKVVAFDEFQTEVCASEILKEFKLWKEYKKDFWKFTRKYVNMIKHIPYGGTFKDFWTHHTEVNRKLTKKEVFANVKIKT